MTMRARTARLPGALLLAVVLTQTLMPSPAAASVSSASFAGYTSAGAMLINALENDNFARSYFVCVNFNPGSFTAAQADAAFNHLLTLVVGGNPASASPSQVAAFGFAPTTLMQEIQSIYQQVGDGYVVLDLKKTASGNVQVDVYRHSAFVDQDVFFMTATFVLPASILG